MASNTLFAPCAESMTSFWRQTPGSLDTHRTSPTLPASVDIAIIGAGYSGGSLVTHLLDHPDTNAKTILVLEARQLCSGATGHNGGHLKPDAYNLISKYAERFGVEAAAEVADFEIANVTAVRDFVRDKQVDCEFFVTRAVDVQLDAAHNEKLKEAYQGLLYKGLDATKEVFYMEGKDAEMLSGIKGAKGAFSYTARHIWPYKLVHHMFDAAIKRGVNFQTNTPVTKLSDSQDSTGFWIIETPRGLVCAKSVIVATNAYTGSVLPEYAPRIIPCRGVCSHIAVPPIATGRSSSKGQEHIMSGPPLLANTYAIRLNENDFDYLIPRRDGSVVVGGARSVYIHDIDAWYGNVNDDALIAGSAEYFDGYMQRHFRGWESSEATTDAVWTGIMGYSADQSPHIGPVPNRARVFLMAGFTGHGMPQIFLAAKGLVEMVAGKSYAETGLPRIFEATEARLESKENWLLQAK